MNASVTDQRVFNFSAGPAALPVPALEQAQRELLAYGTAGASVMEISHRSKAFADIQSETTERLRRLLQIPEQYKILYLQGGSRLQFSMIPMNLLRGREMPADYLLTGSWSSKARDEAVREGPVQLAWDGAEDRYARIPNDGELQLSDEAAYVYFTSNETIQGVQFQQEPAGNGPLVCDASSDFLSRPLDMERYGLIYACAQKNVGPAGVTVVVVNEDLLNRSSDELPGYLNYQSQAKHDSTFNTPPTFAVYMVGLVLKWLEEDIGGLEAMRALNQRKAALLYDLIDSSGGFYRGHAQTDCRSMMNVTFRLPSEDLEQAFTSQAAKSNLCNLKGHRSVGGIRASIYNAMPLAGVQCLRDFMARFMTEHRGQLT